MTTPFNLSVSVSDNITGETGLVAATFNVNNVVGPPPPASQCVFGVYDPANDGAGSFTGMQQFTAAPIKVGTYYVQWNGPFPTSFANICQAHGFIPFVEIEPWFSTTTWPAFNTIASGAFDAYLTSFGASIASFGQTVWLTFAHEMNGSWYPWGNGGPQGITPSQWIAAWKHVHDVINAAAPGLVKWVWAPNNNDVGPVTPYWPGPAYVDIPAYDGYIQNASQTFANFQAGTVNEIRSLTSIPIWNSECGVNPTGAGQPAAIAQFIADMKSAGLSGFMWWNQSPFNVSGSSLTAVTNGVNLWNA